MFGSNYDVIAETETCFRRDLKSRFIKKSIEKLTDCFLYEIMFMNKNEFYSAGN